MGGDAKLSGPDLQKDGASIGGVGDGATLVGHAMGERVLVVRRGDRFHAIGATCTHYGGPLDEGRVDGDQVRCPWHHACFDVRTGEAIDAPALAPVPCFDVETRGDKLFVLGKKAAASPRAIAAPSSVVIVGGGAAGLAAAEMLRRKGWTGSLTMLSADANAPYDRPNASKDYLAGTAPEEWMPLRGDEWYAEQKIDLRLGVPVSKIDVEAHRVHLASGDVVAYQALILATGAEPIRLPIPGADREEVHVLRSLADSRGIVARASAAKRAVVIGASFIGLEAAAALRTRGLEVHVVAPETQPLARVLGDAIGGVVRGVHASKGVVFHLGRKPASIEKGAVTLDDGARVEADLVVMGVGVRPRLELAQAAGLAIDRGVVVDETLRTSAKDVWAAGDIARWNDRRFGIPGGVRIEHWVVAERQGQHVARNVLATHGAGTVAPFDDVPFFWSNHFDAGLAYVGHAESWDAIDVAGDLEARDFAAAFRKSGRTLAVVTMGRDRASLDAEAALRRGDEGALRTIVPPTKTS